MIGRKYTFLVTIVIMGLSTFIVGLLPNYATIGVAAPVILIALRMLQGLAPGGEYGGAAGTLQSMRRITSAVSTPLGSRPLQRWVCSCR